MAALDKRGQITLFVILGIVAVFLIVVLLYTQTDIIKNQNAEPELSTEAGQIKKHISDCIVAIGEEKIKEIAYKGGYLDVTFGRTINGTKVSYLCYRETYDPGADLECVNRMLLKSEMERQLEEAIAKDAQEKCINLQRYAADYNLVGIEKPLVLDVSIELYKITVKVKKDLKIGKGSTTQTLPTFYVIFSYPLGKLYEVSQDIINDEASIGKFDTVGYMMSQKGSVLIERMRPYPDIWYQIKMGDMPDFIFNFLVWGGSPSLKNV